MNPEERIGQLRQAKAQIPGILTRVGMNIIPQTVEKAMEGAPSTVSSLRGTNTRTGEMKQHWMTDNHPRPIRQGDSYVSELDDGKQYASLVNDGHRMDRHFMPGPVINPGPGLLEFNPNGIGGTVVDTQVTYAPGLFVVNKTVEEHHRVLREELKELEELMERT